MPRNAVLELSYAFALTSIHLHRKLLRANEFTLAKQLLRSGTSIGANVEEAQAAQSRADFASKMAIASKEAREANYWLRLLRDAKVLTSSTVERPLRDSEELILLLTRIVKTTRASST